MNESKDDVMEEHRGDRHLEEGPEHSRSSMPRLFYNEEQDAVFCTGMHILADVNS